MAAPLDPAVPLASIRANMSSIKTPGAHNKVYKDECLYTFDNPFSPDGLYVNLSTWGGVGRDFLDFDSKKTNTKLYLHLKYIKVPVDEEEEKKDDEGKAKETVLGIGVEGGFKLDSQKYETVKEYAFVVLGDEGKAPAVIPWPNLSLPEFVGRVVQSIIDHQGVASQSEEAAWLADDPRPISKYAENLVQLNNGVRITNDPSTWKCGDSGQIQNLWLNLSTGYIGSGRAQYVGGQTIGTGAALKHFEETGNAYPLVVKLGTITPHGADVYSYAPDEDCMVTDPKLAEHLAHWGIDAMKLEKTDKSLAELEIDSQKWAFSRITEAGAALVPLRGPGFVGLKNLGNSCYMNSVLQLLFTLPEVRQEYLDRYDTLVKQRAVADPATDVLTQTAKLALGLCSDRYCPPLDKAEEGEKGLEPTKDAEYTPSIEPRMFKYLIGRGHPEFSSGRQQDAAEYLQHLLNILIRAERVGMGDGFTTESLFRYQAEERLQCAESGQVRYSTRPDTWLEIDIPVEAATNKTEVAEYEERKLKRQRLNELVAPANLPNMTTTTDSKKEEKEEPEVFPVVPFDACLERYASPAMIEDWYSSALGRRSVASKSVRFKTFPRYLVIHMKRYYVDASWQPKKLEAAVELPEVLDLTSLKAKGPQADEVIMADNDGGEEAGAATNASSNTAAAPLIPDASMAAQMKPFGFSSNAIKRALIAVQNSSVDQATAWIFEHMEDTNLNDPLPEPSTADGSGSSKGGQQPDPESVSNLAAMLGFTEEQATAALKATDGNMERAADWLFSHSDDMAAAVAQVLSGGGGGDEAGGGEAAAGEGQYSDGEGKYDLIGFISHVGKNTGSGHYVAHIKKGGRWAIFDDQKVAASEKPPKDLGYLYLYVRQDAMEV